MDTFSGALDVVKAILSLGLFIYALTLLRTFRGGIMEVGFKVLAAAPLFFVVTETLNALKNFGVSIYQEKLIADAFEVLFIFALLVGFGMVARAWKRQGTA